MSGLEFVYRPTEHGCWVAVHTICGEESIAYPGKSMARDWVKEHTCTDQQATDR